MKERVLRANEERTTKNVTNGFNVNYKISEQNYNQMEDPTDHDLKEKLTSKLK